ncbi:MAG: hypothetical protein KIG14_03530 [Candidatus Sacchiramonaceae bacterium]|jgi:hypothetical protein|nr:hypothetical protein [Candidatus Saccharimonadaceae bacterium]
MKRILYVAPAGQELNVSQIEDLKRTFGDHARIKHIRAEENEVIDVINEWSLYQGFDVIAITDLIDPKTKESALAESRGRHLIQVAAKNDEGFLWKTIRSLTKKGSVYKFDYRPILQ